MRNHKAKSEVIHKYLLINGGEWGWCTVAGGLQVCLAPPGLTVCLAPPGAHGLPYSHIPPVP